MSRFHLFSLVVLLLLVTSCSKDDDPVDELMLKGTITEYNDFGAAFLDITEADMTAAGFTLGDIISIAVDDKDPIVMPYYDGFYNRNGEYVCVAYPTSPTIRFTANNIGLPSELMGLEGHSVTIRMREPGGSLDVQKAMSMTYSNDRNDYPNISDAAYANARAVIAGNIRDGRLYRSSSPFNNDINRAFYVSQYLEDVGVKTVLDLNDTEDDLLGYVDMPPYSRTLWEGGNVIICTLKTDPTADEYNERLIAALKVLPTHPAPYVVHCMEGKDRTGYVCALLEGLCGATYDEIVADYLVTYNNYYGITPATEADVCNALVSLRLNTCLMYYAGIDDESQLPRVNFANAFAHYLLTHGMNRQELDDLVDALTQYNVSFCNFFAFDDVKQTKNHQIKK